MLVQMHDICKDYPMGKGVTHVLKHINLEVEEGSYLAIMGPSGSGKSTLMNLIGCLDVPTSGEYLLAGRDMTTLSDDEMADVRNKEIGFVFQSFHLLPKLTALENAALPLMYGGVPKDKRHEMAREALKTVGLEDRVDHRPDQLSGGQCQRVAIARAIVGSPRLLLADEPTGALDSESGRMVLDIFSELHKKGSTIIMITHDAGVASHADKIDNIYDGVLSEGVSKVFSGAQLEGEFGILESAGALEAAEDSVELHVLEGGGAIPELEAGTDESQADDQMPEPADAVQVAEASGDEAAEANSVQEEQSDEAGNTSSEQSQDPARDDGAAGFSSEAEAQDQEVAHDHE